MRYAKVGQLVVLVILACVLGMAAVHADEVKAVMKAPSPFLVTAAGQTPDVLMVKIVSEREKLSFTYKALAEASDLTGMNTLLLVMGVSMKGLGSAGLNMDQELSRIDDLIAAAKMDRLVVIKTGDKDGFLLGISKANGIPLYYMNSVVDLTKTVAGMFK